jgi:hypothetical protein
MKVKSLICYLVVLLAGVAWADSADKVWIIAENTGNPATFVKLEKPDLVAGQTIMVYLEQAGLSGKWGEGSVNYTYTYYSETGKKIWSSKEQTVKKLTKDATWLLSSVIEITMPAGIPDGAYRIAFELKDYHTQKIYNGNIHFTIGMGKSVAVDPPVVPAAPVSAPAATPGPAAAPAATAAGSFTYEIADVELTLVSLVRKQDKLVFSFRVLNRGDMKINLQMYPYQTSFIDSNGKEVKFDKWGGNGSLCDGQNFVPGIQTQADLEMKIPESLSNNISYLEIPFYGQDERLKWKNLPVPFSAGE